MPIYFTATAIVDFVVVQNWLSIYDHSLSICNVIPCMCVCMCKALRYCHQLIHTVSLPLRLSLFLSFFLAHSPFQCVFRGCTHCSATGPETNINKLENTVTKHIHSHQAPNIVAVAAAAYIDVAVALCRLDRDRN